MEGARLFTDEQAPAIPQGIRGKDFHSLRHPLWTENKARLIREYLKLFTFITKHGIYIDGFAAPQEPDKESMWSAKLVLETEPKWMREFWLCDLSTDGISRLERLAAAHDVKPRRVRVLAGDFNDSVHTILSAGTILETKATFALLDQRTFECHWETVRALARLIRRGPESGLANVA